MYMENSWRAPVLPGSSDLNFVKPPMVDREGVIMCPNLINQFGDANLANVHNEDGNQLVGFENLTPSGGNALTQPYDDIKFLPNRGLGINAIAPLAEDNQARTGYNGYTKSDGTTFRSRGPGAGLHSGASNAAYTDTVGTGGNYIHPYQPTVNKWMGSTAPGNIRSQTWTNRLDNTYVTWPSTIRPEPLIKSETRQRNESDARQYRVQDYMEFLANVKNIPVGIQPQKSFIASDDALNRAYNKVASDVGQTGGETLASNWNFTSVSGHLAINDTNKSSVTYSVSLPIFSGIIGLWAEKQFPTMLISPGSFYIQIKFAKAAQAFQCAMDPCRRVFGTYRDYVPNAGLPTNYQTEYRGQNLDATKSACIAASDGTAGKTYMALTTAGTLGWDFAWQGFLGLAPPTVAVGNTLDLGISNGGKGNGFRNNLIENCRNTKLCGGGTKDTDKAIIFGALSNSADPVAANGALPAYPTALSATIGTTQVYSSNFVGQGEGFTTGNAKPQYVPRKTPWLSGGNGFQNGWCDATLGSTDAPYKTSNTSSDAAYVLEKFVCYGTYLPASTAQVRRTTQYTNSALPIPSTGATNVDVKPTYTVTNLKYVGQQTILPDEVTASIVRTAAASDISLHAQSVRTYRTLMSNSTTQNLILPVKVASANSMWVIFQNQSMIENVNYCSLTRTCPFTSFQWTPSAQKFFVGSETSPTVNGISTSSNAFNIQLRIGNELLPMQPINSIQQLMIELVRSIHGMGDMDTNLPMFGTIKSAIKNTTNASIDPASASATNFTMLKNNEFCTPYVPVDALDDQTITNNPLFMDYLQYGQTISATGTSTATHTAPTGPAGNVNNFNSRGQYVLPHFLPPVSKFLLGFDLDTFPGTNDTARSGRYLGNAPLTLQMTNTMACVNTSIKGGSTDTIIATAVVLHDIRFSIMAGGQVLAYY